MKTSTARYLACSLDAYGVTHIFFVPLMLKQTLAEMEMRTRIARVLTHGEKAAVYMADGYARASGRPGVCFAQAIGGSNLAAGLRDPFLAHSPVIAFTGCAKPETRNRATYQQIDDRDQFRPVTKWQAHIDRGQDLAPVLRQAFRVATTGSPGPVSIQMPDHTGDLEYEEGDFEIDGDPTFCQVPPFRPRADEAIVREAAQRIAAAERPVLVAGGGCRHSGAGEAVAALARKLQVPIITSLTAKGVVRADDPLNAGVAGTYSRRSANQTLAEADLVVFAGSGTGSMVTCRWKLPRPETPVIQIDIAPEELGRHYRNTLGILGDARTVLEQIAEAAGPAPENRKHWLARAAKLACDWRNDVAAMLNSDALPVRPERLCGELSKWLPEDTLVVVDTGYAAMWMAAFLDLMRPGQSFIRAAGSLGWGLPAALGAKLAQPDRPVVLFTGDGGFWYHIAELETAVRWGINAVIVVNNNQCLNQIREDSRPAYGGVLKGWESELWHFSDVNFAAIAESMGAMGIRVGHSRDLAAAFDASLSANRPCVIDVLTDPDAMAPLAWLGEGITTGCDTSDTNRNSEGGSRK